MKFTAFAGVFRKSRRAWRLRPVAMAVCMLGLHQVSPALPQGANTVAGQVSIQTGQPGQMLIQQGSSKAIVNWDNFSLNVGEWVRINQPSSTAVLLNRVVGADPSYVLGNIQSNGRVFLVNPRGIVFGKNSQIDVGGFLGSTLQIRDEDFLAGRYVLAAGGDTPGSLKADGTISAPGGTVALVSPVLSVGGTIAASRVGVASASQVQVDVEGDGLIYFNVSNQGLDSRLDVLGKLQAADGGTVDMRAQARAGFADTVLNMSGVVQARSLLRRSGLVVINGGDSGVVSITGTVDASGAAVGQSGGDVKVLGEKVGLFAGARIVASGPGGGGTVLVGGGYQGQGQEPNSQSVYMGRDASIDASATGTGNGGLVVLWSQDSTKFLGTINARGGLSAGDGGFVETSSKNFLSVAGKVRTDSTKGAFGSWLLDPANIDVVAGNGETNMGGAGTEADPFKPNANNASIGTDVITTALASNNVLITTSGAGTQAGNIKILAPIDWTSAHSLTLQADNKISVQLVAGNPAFTIRNRGSGSLTLNADGAVDLTGNVDLAGGSFAVNGKVGTGGAASFDSSAASIATGGGAVNIAATGSILTGNISTLGGGDGTLTLSAGGNVTLGATTVGRVIASSSGGFIGQSGLISVTQDGSSFTTSTAGQQIDLSTSTNGFGGHTVAVNTNGASGDVALKGDALNFGSSTVGGKLTAVATTGGITQAGAITTGANGSSFTTSTAGQQIDLSTSTNGFGGHTVAVNTSGASGDVALKGDALDFGSSTVGGKLTAVATTGGITQAGAITTGANGSSFTTSTAGQQIDLSTSTNGFGGHTVAVNTSGASGDVALKGDALNFGSSTVGGKLTAVATTGGITQAGAITTGANGSSFTTSTAGQQIDLSTSTNGFGGHTVAVNTSGASGDVALKGDALNFGSSTVGGKLTAVATTGSITQAGAITTGANGSSFTTSTAGQQIDLSTSTNGFGGHTVAVNTSGASGDVALKGDALNFGSSTVGGKLTAVATTGGITQAGAITTGANGSSFTTSTAGQQIDLSTSTNGFGGHTVAVNTSGASGDVALKGDALNFGSSTVGGKLTAVATTGGITQAGAITTGANGSSFTTSTAGQQIDLSTSTNGFGAHTVALNTNGAGGDASIRSDALNFGASSVGGSLVAVTSGGDIVQSAALLVAGSSNVDAGTGAIAIANSGNDFQSGVTLIGGTVSVRAANNLIVNALTNGANSTVSLVAGGTLDISSLAGGIHTGTADLTLASDGGSLSTLGPLAGNNLVLTGASGLSLTQNVTAAGSLALNSTTGGISQTGGAISAGGLSAVSAGAGAITLQQGGNVFQGAVSLSGGNTQISGTRPGAGGLTLGTLATGDLSVSTNGVLDLGRGTVTGTLTAASGNGNITQAGGLTVTGTSSLNAGTGTITLAHSANDFQAGVTVSGSSVSLRDTNNLVVDSLTNGANGAVSLVAGGSLDISALAGGIDTGTADLTLASNGGSLSTPGPLAGNNLVLTGATGLNLTQNIAAAGTLGLNATNSAINQTGGAISAGGLSTVSAGTGAISLQQSGNDFQAAVSLSGGATQITDTNALTLGTLATGNLGVTSGGALDLGQGTVTGTLTAVSGNGNITQTGGLTVTGTSSLNAGTGTITLANSANNFQSTVDLSGGATQITDTNALTLGTLATGNLGVTSGGALDLGQGTVTGTLTAASGNGNITQTGGLTVTGTSGLNAGTGTITLANAGNDFQSVVSLSGGATQITDTNALTLGTLATGNLGVTSGGALNLGQGTVTGTLTAVSGNGNITQTGGLTVTGTSSLNAGTGTITLANAGNDFQAAVSLSGGATQITDTNALTLGTLATGNLGVTSGGALNLGQGTVTGTLTAASGNGNITQTGGLTVTGTSGLNAGTGTITLANAGNDFQSAVSLSGGATQITDTNALTLGTLATGNLGVTSGGALNLGQGTVTGTLTAVSGNGNITQTGGLTVTGTSSLNAGTGTITLANAGNDFQSVVSLSGGATQITDTNALTLGTLATGNLGVTSGGALNLGQGTVTGTLTAASGNGNITQTGGLTVTGTSSLNAGTGTITLANSGNDFQSAVSLSGGATQITDTNALTLGTLATGNLGVTSSGALDLGQGTVTGTLTAASGNGNITQTGGLTVTGTSSLNAGTGTITLANAGNDFQSAVSLSGGATQITDTNALTLGTLATGNLGVTSGGALNLGQGTVTGTLTAASGNGNITQTGGLTVTGSSSLNAGAGSITLAHTGNDFQGAVSLTADSAQLTDANALTVGGSANSLLATAATALTLNAGSYTTLGATSGGGISQAGALTVAGLTTLTANQNAIPVTLTDPANDFATVQLAQANGGSFTTASLTDVGDLTVGGVASSLNARAGGALNLAAGTYTTLSADATTGLSQSGALRVAGSATLAGDAGMAVDLSTLGSGNAFNTVVLATHGGGSLGNVAVSEGNVPADGLRIGGNAASLSVSTQGPVTLTGGSYGTLSVDSHAGNGDVSQSGVIGVSGTTLLNTGNGDATLTQAGNDFNVLSVVNGRSVTVRDANDLVVAGSQVTGQLSLGAPGTVSFSGDLTGAGRLVVAGSGTVLVNSTLTYAGGTVVNGGTLAVEGAGAQAGTATVVLGSAGTLDVRQGGLLTNAVTSQGGVIANSAGAGAMSGPVNLQANTTVNVAASAAGLTIGGALSDGGSAAGLTKLGGGVLTLAAANAYAGATQISGGHLVAAATGALPATSAVVVEAAATLDLAANQTAGSLAGGGHVELAANTLAVGGDNTSTVFSGAMSGSGGLIKQGSGGLTLSGANSFSGATQVLAGGLALSNGAALSDASPVSLATGANLSLVSSETIGSLAGAGTVQLNAQRLTLGANDGSTSFSGAISGAGGITKLGAGVFTLDGSNSYTGPTVVEAGTLRLASSTALNAVGDVSLAAAGTLDLQSSQTIGSLSGAGQVALHANALDTGGNGSTTEFSGGLSGSGGLTKSGAGSFTLSGTNDYTGATTLRAGTLTLAGGNALSDLTAVKQAAGTTLALQGSETIGSLEGAGQVRLAANTLTTGGNGADTRFDGSISGTGGLTKEGGGVMVLGGGNSYTGSTLIAAGVLQVGAGGAAGTLGSGAVIDNATLKFQRADSVTIDNAISGPGALVVGQGQVTLTSAANSYTGQTLVSGGELATSGAQRLPDATAVQVDAGAKLSLGGNETVASINASGSVTALGDISTAGDQRYLGSLILAGSGPVHLTANHLVALSADNQLGAQPLSISATDAQVFAAQTLNLGDVTLGAGGQVTAERLGLQGNLTVNGGTLGLTATATPDAALAVKLVNAQVPLTGLPLAVAEETVSQTAGAISVASGATLNVTATGGGSVNLGQAGNAFNGALSVLSGPAFNTAWQPHVVGAVGVQSQVNIAGSTVNVGGSGVEGDMVQISADRLSTSSGAALAARLPYDNVSLGTSLSAPSMLLNLGAAAFEQPFTFGAAGDKGIHVVVGSTSIGNRTSGPNAGFLTIRPKGGAKGSTAVFLLGPNVSAEAGGYKFFNDGAGIQTEIPVFYNGVLPQTPQVSGALSSVAAVAEEARRARFEEAVRTENVAVRLRSGVIAEVGPGRPATVGTQGAKAPETCPPRNSLSCESGAAGGQP